MHFSVSSKYYTAWGTISLKGNPKMKLADNPFFGVCGYCLYTRWVKGETVVSSGLQ